MMVNLVVYIVYGAWRKKVDERWIWRRIGSMVNSAACVVEGLGATRESLAA